MNGILIPFQPDMVHAILTCAKCGHLSIPFPCEHCGSTEFAKTQTRRIVKFPKPAMKSQLLEHQSNRAVYPARVSGWVFWSSAAPHLDEFTKEKYDFGIECPYGKPGDQLVVREKLIRCQDSEASKPMVLYDVGRLPVIRDGAPTTWDWKPSVLPSRYMPRWAGRIPLVNRGVRVERVQDISEEDAKAEGCFDYEMILPRRGTIGGPAEYKAARLVVAQYHKLWDSINAKRGYGWDANPWVWAIEFKRI